MSLVSTLLVASRLSQAAAASSSRIRLASSSTLLCNNNYNTLRGSNTTATSIRWNSSVSHPPKIGFIGLGNMGYPMCQNLAKNNHQIVAFDANEQTRNSIPASSSNDNNNNSIQIVNSLEETAECSILFTMLPGCEPVNHVMSTLLQHKQQQQNKNNNKTIFIDCSTVNPSTSRYWSEQIAESNLGTTVDAPVSGGVKGATDGTLTFMVGRNPTSNLYNEYNIETLLLQMGKSVVDCGSSGTGSATKLCNNLALACQMIGICEAMNLGESLDVDPQVLANVMNMSTAKCWSCEVNNPHPDVAALRQSPASNDYQGGFSTQLMLKDLTLALSAAQEIITAANNNNSNMAVPMGTLAKELYQLVHDQGHANKDFGYMLQFLKHGGSSSSSEKVVANNNSNTQNNNKVEQQQKQQNNHQ